MSRWPTVLGNIFFHNENVSEAPGSLSRRVSTLGTVRLPYPDSLEEQTSGLEAFSMVPVVARETGRLDDSIESDADDDDNDDGLAGIWMGAVANIESSPFLPWKLWLLWWVFLTPFTISLQGAVLNLLNDGVRGCCAV